MRATYSLNTKQQKGARKLLQQANKKLNTAFPCQSYFFLICESAFYGAAKTSLKSCKQFKGPINPV